MFSSIVLIQSRHASHLQRLFDLEFNLHLAFGYNKHYAIDISYMNLREEGCLMLMCVLGNGCIKAFKHLSKQYPGFSFTIESVNILDKEIRRDVISLGLMNSMRGLFMCRSTLKKYVSDMKITDIVPEGDVDTWWDVMYGSDTGHDQFSPEVEVFYVDNELITPHNPIQPNIQLSTTRDIINRHHQSFRRLSF